MGQSLEYLLSPFPCRECLIHSTVHRSLIHGFRQRLKSLRRVPSRSGLHRPFGQRSSTRGFGPHRDITKARPPIAEVPKPLLRAVLGLSRPFDGLLRTLACRLVSSRSRVQGSSTFRGFDPSRSASRLIAGWLPPCRWLPGAHRPLRIDGHTHEPRLRGLIPREDAWLVPQGLAATRLAPLFGFSVSSRIFRAPSLRITPQLPLLTLPVNTYCLRTRIHWPTSASYQHSNRLGHL
jgi:hypothetical protein